MTQRLAQREDVAARAQERYGVGVTERMRAAPHSLDSRSSTQPPDELPKAVSRQRLLRFVTPLRVKHQFVGFASLRTQVLPERFGRRATEKHAAVLVAFAQNVAAAHFHIQIVHFQVAQFARPQAAVEKQQQNRRVPLGASRLPGGFEQRSDVRIRQRLDLAGADFGNGQPLERRCVEIAFADDPVEHEGEIDEIVFDADRAQRLFEPRVAPATFGFLVSARPIDEEMLQFGRAALTVATMLQKPEQVFDEDAARGDGMGRMKSELAVQQPVVGQAGQLLASQRKPWNVGRTS